eukprot:SM000408S15245  [mRNA]  locus=s408:7603:12340:+ [translate_table: standard]
MIFSSVRLPPPRPKRACPNKSHPRPGRVHAGRVAWPLPTLPLAETARPHALTLCQQSTASRPVPLFTSLLRLLPHLSTRASTGSENGVNLAKGRLLNVQAALEELRQAFVKHFQETLDQWRERMVKAERQAKEKAEEKWEKAVACKGHLSQPLSDLQNLQARLRAGLPRDDSMWRHVVVIGTSGVGMTTCLPDAGGAAIEAGDESGNEAEVKWSGPYQ